MAATTLSKFASGSPLPIMTTLLTRRSPLGVAPRARFAIHSWPMISAVLRLRLKPCLPVEQNLQSSAQPACEEMHRVPLLASGMNTLSTALPLPASISHFRVPSAAVASEMTRGGSIVALAASLSRRVLARSLIFEKSASPYWCIQRSSCLARNGFSPISAKKPLNCAASWLSRFGFTMALDSTRVNVQGREEIGNFDFGRVHGVRAMHRVGIDT